MLILWIRKNPNARKTETRPEKQEDTFKKHDEAMQRFVNAHPKRETKAPGNIIRIEDNPLAAVTGVKLSDNSQN